MSNRLKFHSQDVLNLKLGEKENQKIKTTQHRVQPLTITYQNIRAVFSKSIIKSVRKNTNIFAQKTDQWIMPSRLFLLINKLGQGLYDDPEMTQLLPKI